jgi:hypothetical protein
LHDSFPFKLIGKYLLLYTKKKVKHPHVFSKPSSVESSIASEMAAATTTGHPTSNWRDEMQG